MKVFFPKAIFLFIVAWMAFIAFSEPITTLPISDKLEGALLEASDIPGSWRTASRTVKENSAEVSLQRRDAYLKIGRTISQEITIYETKEEALEAFLDVKSGYPTQEALSKYAIFLNSDESFIVCAGLDNASPLKFCMVYSLYGNVLMYVGSGIYEEDDLPFSTFKGILLRIDEQMISAFG